MTARGDARQVALLEAASQALAEQTGMVVCWHEYRDMDELLASGCPQCLVDTALADLRSQTRGSATAANSQRAPE